MDTMNIVSKFTTKLISDLLTKTVRKKLGYNADLKLNAIKVDIENGQTRLSLDIDASMPNEELMRIVSQVVK